MNTAVARVACQNPGSASTSRTFSSPVKSHSPISVAGPTSLRAIRTICTSG